MQRLKQVLVDDRGAVQDQKEIERGRDPSDDSDERNADADVFKEIEEREAARSARDDERRSLQVAVQKAMIENDIDREREDRERELEAQIVLIQQCLDALQASISVFAAGSNSKIGEGDRKDQHRSEGQKIGPPECLAAEGSGRRGAAKSRGDLARESDFQSWLFVSFQAGPARKVSRRPLPQRHLINISTFNLSY